MTIFNIDFKWVSLSGYCEEQLTFINAAAVPIDFTGTTALEMEIGKSIGATLAAPAIVLTDANKDLFIEQPFTAGKLTFRFYPDKLRRASVMAGVYNFELFRTYNTLRRSFAKGTINFIGRVSGA